MTGRLDIRALVRRPVWLLTAVMAAAAGALWLALDDVPGPAAGPRLTWWELGLAFAAAELCVVHLHFRRSSHSLTLIEIPLVLGLLLATPAGVMAGAMVGAAGALVRRRDMPALRKAFNVALAGMVGGTASVVFRALHDPSAEPGPAAWAAAGIAVVAGGALAGSLITLAMACSGERLRAREVASTVLTGGGVAAINGSLGLAIGAMLIAEPRATILLLAPAAALLLAYRAYTAERNRSRSLQFLYAASRALTGAADVTSGLAGMLAMVRETFRAETALVWTFPGAGEDGGRIAVDGAGHVESAGVPDALGRELSLLLEDGSGRLIDGVQPGLLGEQLRAQGIRSAMVAAVPGARGPVGALLVGDRVGAGGGFDGDELKLFETLSHHLGASLGRDRLGEQVRQLRDMQEHLEHQAFHDGLTGLANRLLMMDRLRHALSRREGNVAVVYLDLDDFKPINDTLGHEAGDELLRETARRLREALRDADTPARLGGDEFAILLVDIEPDNARLVAQRVFDSLIRPVTWAGREIKVGASVGLALANSATVSADELLRRADMAMYVSKHGGKQRLNVYGDQEAELEPVA